MDSKTCQIFETIFTPTPEGYDQTCPTTLLEYSKLGEGECVEDKIAEDSPSIQKKLAKYYNQGEEANQETAEPVAAAAANKKDGEL